MFVDASNTGWGCSWDHLRAHGYLTAEEAAQSINWRELKEAHLALKIFPLPENSTVVLIRTDNTTSLSYINKQGGTRSLPLMELATEDNEMITKLHVLDAGSRRSLYGCVIHPMEQVFESIYKSPLESHFSGLAQDQTGTTSFGDSGGAVLAECSVVPSASTLGSLTSKDATTTSGANNSSQDSSSSTTEKLDALRVEIVRQQLLKQSLNT
ncbi:hypothetical protein HMPREF1544_10382 [Mucor circinelloides 1006PhL]|uniref:Uncharacterized protein n=1 Tax=Mucor circinelloides f. circinelloides (strain 1006PhL) TaxID=1220926 RepID=S2IYJ2_MUCC1|nr:hypothetical protein HMPREF1544_10382 [Mucor circinelloides 1006PhL]